MHASCIMQSHIHYAHTQTWAQTCITHMSWSWSTFNPTSPPPESPPCKAVDKFGTITVRFQTKRSWQPNLRPIIILKVPLSEKSRIIVQFGDSGSKLYLKLQIKLNISTHCHVWQPGCVSKISTGNFWLHGTEKLISSTFWTWLGHVWTKMSLFCEHKVPWRLFPIQFPFVGEREIPKMAFPLKRVFRQSFFGSRFCER